MKENCPKCHGPHFHRYYLGKRCMSEGCGFERSGVCHDCGRELGYIKGPMRCPKCKVKRATKVKQWYKESHPHKRPARVYAQPVNFGDLIQSVEEYIRTSEEDS